MKISSDVLKNSLVKLTLILSCLATAGSSFGVTQYRKALVPFTTNVSALKASVKIDTDAKKIDLKIPYNKLKKRAAKSAKDERVSPVQVYVPRSKKDFSKLVKKISKGDSQTVVKKYLLNKLEKEENKKKRILVDIEPKMIEHLNLTQIGRIMSRVHHNVTLRHSILKKNRSARKELLNQMKLFFSKSERVRIARKIRREGPVSS